MVVQFGSVRQSGKSRCADVESSSQLGILDSMEQILQGTTESVSGAPARSCDIVMKGGITSGVVYPLAVVCLAERFRLRNIGGTSAGAIAAAAAAAAELGRDSGGFDRLARDRKSTRLNSSHLGISYA